eukprot:TRINITY_DN2239_c0_g1_i9.p1 TRINITY_DN2239_c0_g1~~TRINITY_DN2239_c0_g1_i9.p1  ORF type:complete len:223 (-),score=29.35 TRINITY_DN2239_c0_g1_i9:499-1167(-)
MGDIEEPTNLNKSHIEILHTIPESWMLRECEDYKKEMKSCYAFKSRFYQFYVHGKASECSHWEQSFDDCKEWSRNADVEAAKRIIANEKIRIKERLKGHYENNVWEKRTAPPEDWDVPLPDWLLKRQKESNLHTYFDGDKEENERVINDIVNGNQTEQKLPQFQQRQIEQETSSQEANKETSPPPVSNAVAVKDSDKEMELLLKQISSSDSKKESDRRCSIM